MDTLHTLLVGWLVFGVFIVALAKFIYDKFIYWDQSEEDEANDFPGREEIDGPKLPDGGCMAPQPPLPPPIVTRKATIVPEALPEHVSAPVATGGDPDAVRWSNNLLVWFFEGSEGGRILREAWNDNLNEFTVGTALETGVLIEILEFLPQTPAPTLCNIIVDCLPTDDMTVTCDMTALLYMRVQTTRTQREVTTESEYACVVKPLRGRLNIVLQTHQCVALIKFDGWPEVNMELEGVRNNAEGLDEAQLQEVVKEELTSGLRKVILELDFTTRKTFPRFSRERSLPDKVMPVGYDALVREHQTHPPSFESKIPASRTPIPSRSQKVQAPPVQSSMDTQSQMLAQAQSQIQVHAQAHMQTQAHTLAHMKMIANDIPPVLSPTPQVLGLPKAPPIPVAPAEDESRVKRNLELFLDRLPKDRSSGPTFEAKDHSGLTFEPSFPIATNSTFEPVPEFAPGHSPLSRLSMVFSSREKPIDEPSERPQLPKPERIEIELEDDEEDVDELFFQEMKGAEKGSLAGPPPPPRSPIRELESLKDSFKDSHWSNPYNKHLQGGSSFSLPLAAQSSSPVGIVGLNGKRLLVKVVKASGVGGEAGVSSCYTVVEMDDPAQKFTTNVIKDTSSPFWDEQFLFDLSDNTLELLFELYDKADGRFVGLGIVGIEELVATPSQRQIIPLQARPYEKDEVTGSLTCEFLFLDRADLPDLTLRKIASGQSSTGRVTTITTTYIKPTENKHPEEEMDATNRLVAEAALKDLEERHRSSPQAPNTRSTLIIHASRKPVEELNYDQEDDADYKPGVSAALGTNMTPPPIASSTPQRHSAISGTPSPRLSAVDIENFQSASASADSAVPASNGLDTVDDRGRSRNRRKRDFFGSLRRKFSRSKVRSKSVDPTGISSGADRAVEESLDRDPLSGRSISMERSAFGTRSRGLLTVPMIIRGRSTTSGGGVLESGGSGSTRSSLSGTSGLSSASTKTYINEASLLVVETLENGVIKHYLVPLSLQRKSKWRKKGTKLHIYNEHTFVAKHLSSSLTCQVCEKGIGRRLGKQGYECRDCSFRCHKPCHVKAEIACPNSTVNSMDLIYIKDERADKRKRLLNS